MKTKNQNQKLLVGLATMGLLAPSLGLALGIDSSELLLSCSGTVTVTGIKSKHLVPVRQGRAGELPAYAYASFNVEVSELGPECGPVEKLIDVNLLEAKLATSKTYNGVTDPLALDKLAAAEVGKVYPFHTEQNFHHKEPNGNLPFYPLLSGQTVVLKAGISIAPFFEAKPVKSYLIEEEKVELTQAIFSKLKANNYAENSFNNSLHHVLTSNHPNFDDNFEAFLKDLLVVFAHHENKNTSVTEPDLSYSTNFTLLSLAQGVATLTNKYPQYYAFDIPVLLSEHASLLQQSYLPNMTSIDLEEALELFAQNLKAEKVSPALKLGYHGVLKNIAGHYQPGSAVVRLASQKAKDLAKSLLNTYYAL